MARLFWAEMDHEKRDGLTNLIRVFVWFEIDDWENDWSISDYEDFKEKYLMRE